MSEGMSNGITAPAGAQNVTETQGLQGTSIERQTSQAMAMAEKGREIVRARIMQAVARPRDFMLVRQRILSACLRPVFATVALFHKPVGKKDGKQQFAVGPSIRFAEEALRAMGNMDVTQTVIYEDSRVRTLAIVATDLESNTSTGVEVTIEKTVERRFVKEGQTKIGTRQNSYGETVYLIEANEDEFAVKAAAQLSKARRNVIMQLVPGDIVEEARAQIEATIEGKNSKLTPEQKRKDLIDWYLRAHGITAAQLSDYVGKPLDQATSEEMKELERIGRSIHAEELTWSQALAAAKEGRETPVDPEAAKAKGAAVISKVQTAKPAKPETVTVPVDDAPPHDLKTGEVTPEPGGVATTHALLKKEIADMVEPTDVEAVVAKLKAAEELLGTGVAATLWKALRAAALKIPGAPKF